MGKLRTLILIIVLCAAVYFGAQQFGFFGANLEKIKAIDAQFGLSGAQLAPATQQELSNYKKAIEKIEHRSDEEKNIVNAKIALAEMQESLLEHVQASSAVRQGSYACGPNSSIQKAKDYGENAVEKAQKALLLIGKLSPSQKQEFFGSNAEETISAVIEAVQGQVEVLKTVC